MVYFTTGKLRIAGDRLRTERRRQCHIAAMCPVRTGMTIGGGCVFVTGTGACRGLCGLIAGSGAAVKPNV